MAQEERATTPKPAPFEGAGFALLLDHVLSYPGTYELPLRTMYTLNSSPTFSPPSSPTSVVGNAFPKKPEGTARATSTATAAAALQANIASQMSSQPSSPQSLPPSFITSFVSRVFTPQLENVDFPQALASLDYLKDLEKRRETELNRALEHLGLDPNFLGERERIARDLPGVLAWTEDMEMRLKKVRNLYSHVYLGLRRWIMVNEMSLPFNKASCIAMLNTLYPPVLNVLDFVKPTPTVTAEIMKHQRASFFRYINTVEKKGSEVLNNVMSQHARPGEANGWPKMKEDLDHYLREANYMIEECLEVTGRSVSPRSSKVPSEDEQKRKVDSGVSFGSASGYNSNRSSGQSHGTRPSTSSSNSTSNHSRHTSREKALPSAPVEEDETVTVKPAGSALERIARELRKIGSRGNMREESRSRLTVNTSIAVEEAETSRSSARSLGLKRSIRNLRSASRSRGVSVSRPGSGAGQASHMEEVPNFDPDAMRRQRAAWEAQHTHAR